MNGPSPDNVVANMNMARMPSLCGQGFAERALLLDPDYVLVS
jgi:hypothetical protein